MSIDRFAQIILINGKIYISWFSICKGSKTILWANIMSIMSKALTPSNGGKWELVMHY